MTIFFLSSFMLFLLVLLLSYISPFSKKPKLPPSPRGLPIIGNLLQFGSLPHRSLVSLSQKIGPLMLIRLGRIPILIASSPSAAQEILKTQDQFFASRPQPRALKMFSGGQLISFAPYGEFWRQTKKITILHLLNSKRIQSFGGVRTEEAALMVGRIEEARQLGAVNVSEMLYAYSNGVVSRAAAGEGERAGERAKKFREIMEDVSFLLRGFQIDDLFPSLWWMGRITGLDAKLERMGKRWDEFLSGIVEEHKQRAAAGEVTKREDFVDVLLSVMKDETRDFVFTEKDIRALIMDMTAAGTDTSFVTMEWTMSELIRNPRVMKKLQEEVRKITEPKAMVEEEDIEQMNYLKAVVKENFRLHTPAPLLITHESTKDTIIQGYEIPAKTRVIINAWAIGQDSESWDAPDEFRPERFMGSSIDFKGHDFQFIPFGAGRRVCPGMHFALAGLELALANLIYHFNWALPDGMKGEDIDMSEAPGITIPRKHALRLIATRHMV